MRPKDDDDQMMGRMDGNNNQKTRLQNLTRPIEVEIDWSAYTKSFEATPREQLMASLERLLLQAKSQVSADLVKQYADQSGRENFIKTATLQVMSLPEYQLC